MKKLMILLLGILLLLTSCGAETEQEEQISEHGGTPEGRAKAVAVALEVGEDAMDALMEGDGDTVSALCDRERSKAFDTYFRALCKHMITSKCYSMDALEVRGEKAGDTWEYTVTLRATFSNGNMFRLEGIYKDGAQTLERINIYTIVKVVAENRVSDGWRIAHQCIFWLSFAFYIWMLVDICLRSLGKGQKVLWGFVCLLTAGFTVYYFPGNFSVLPLIGWLFSWRDCSLVGNLLTVDIYLPVGAVVYFFLRKKLTLKYLAKRKKYYEALDALRKEAKQ